MQAEYFPILVEINSGLNKVARKRAAQSLREISDKIHYRLNSKEFKSKYEQKAYRSVLSYLAQERELLK